MVMLPTLPRAGAWTYRTAFSGGLQRVLDLGSYRTAWSLLHKLRRAMARPDRERLRGTAEVDESYLGAPEPGKHGRQPSRKALIVAAVECVGARQLGRIRRVPNARGQRHATGGVHRGERRAREHGDHR